VLVAANITKYHGPQLVLDGVTVAVPPRARTGLVGPNGAGKSTLLRILAGTEEPDRGSVRRTPSSLGVGYLPQEAPSGGRSGGEAARRRLADFLRRPLAVYLLDEPTNDLDFAGLDWLERTLASLDGAVVLVSHDRDFLDRIVDRIVELDEWTHGLTEYAGGWSEYERARTSALRRQRDAYEQYASERARLEEQQRRMQEWERRGYGQGRKKKKSKDVKKAYAGRIERLDRVEKPYEPWELRLDLAPPARSGDVVARLRSAVVERESFRLGPIDLELGWAERLAVLGPNGSGKTTLLDALLGRVPLAQGERRLGTGVVVGELSQQRGELEHGVLLDAFTNASGLPGEPARTLLAKFGLGADHVLRDVGSLSPGERTRAVVALFAARRVNCLILDEPTNHLDVAAIEELERALDTFAGTVVLVTHDRQFLRRFRATRTLELPPSPVPDERAAPARRGGRRGRRGTATSS
jgi:ATPase subunit of ABC transporter with duplicated ATPase domains